MAVILIVDDSKFTRNQLVRSLADEPYQIQEAVNGQDAYDKIKVQKPACVITDLLMPVMDGQGLLKKIQDDGLNIPIIVITADIQEGTRELCLKLGAREVINKPPKKGQLKEAINRALNKKGE